MEEYRTRLAGALENLKLGPVLAVAEALSGARDAGRHIYVFGNGGSAATASHFAGDLNKGAIREGKARFRVQCLNDNVPAVTAWANDKDYGAVFAEQLGNFVEAGDVVVAISGSGNSPNVLYATRLAKTEGAFTVGLTGFGGGKLKELVDLAVVAPSDNMERVEDTHLAVCHMITTCLREAGR